ncbi:virulence factor BrkB family protein [Marinobacterium arenosum]|uniref:virulence factor BrkB family protein n=1 Tax=Marinobacterium arenosum TaxID=2862496 RepID=UPI001C970654|nr:virulence factor BrkB family protein [Marinobacterium arenosum]MBY4677104.1 virulence factor BrkB family protein [Marinobacterium arenosum]
MRDVLQSHPVRFVGYLFRQFIANQGILNASALTYTTLFAVVPLMTVSYAMLAAVPSFQGVGEQLQGWIFDNFVPATGAVVQEYMRDFASQARKLTGVGVAFLLVTAIMMMRNIESAFNRIWRVSEARKGLSSFLIYWAILSLGPILIGVGLLLTSYIASISVISTATDLVGRARLLSLLPMLLSAAAFTLLYAAVPNCRVPLKHALIGGVVVALLFETAKRGFALFVTQFPSYELIYGAFAAVPLFLAWIFITWTLILLGAELTRALSVYRRSERGRKVDHLHTLMAVLYRLWCGQQRGETLSDRTLLRQVAGLDQSRWDSYQQLLLGASLIRRSEQGEYLLCRDLDTLSVAELCELLPWPLPPGDDVAALGGWQRQLNQRLNAVEHSRKAQLNISLQQLFSEADNAPADEQVVTQQKGN